MKQRPLTITFEMLRPYHVNKIMDEARRWRLEHHAKILKKMIDHMRAHGHLPSSPPCGPTIFKPSEWSAPSWVWFSSVINREHMNPPR